MSCEANYKVWNGRRFCPQNWLPWQCPLGDRKNNFTSFIDGHSSTNAINFMKIGLVDVEIIGLTKISKNTHTHV